MRWKGNSSYITTEKESSPSAPIGGIISCNTGALSGKYTLIGIARTVYAESAFGPDGSVLPGLVCGFDEGGGGGRGRGRIRDENRENESKSSDCQFSVSNRSWRLRERWNI